MDHRSFPNNQLEDDIPDTDLDDYLEDYTEEIDVPLSCDAVHSSIMQGLLKTQNGLNENFVGKDWIERARCHKDIDYIPALLDEATELMRSLVTWKFWKKNQVPDLQNAKMELIDMLHFTLSEALLSYREHESVANHMGFWYEQVYFYTPFEGEVIPKVPEYNYIKAKAYLFTFLSSTFAVHYSSNEEAPSEVDLIDWEAFWNLSFNLGLSLRDILGIYRAKVALNKFRIDKNDSTGKYLRYWQDGKEDNYYLMNEVEKRLSSSTLLEKVPTIHEMYTWLENNYITKPIDATKV